MYPLKEKSRPSLATWPPAECHSSTVHSFVKRAWLTLRLPDSGHCEEEIRAHCKPWEQTTYVISLFN